MVRLRAADVLQRSLSGRRGRWRPSMASTLCPLPSCHRSVRVERFGFHHSGFEKAKTDGERFASSPGCPCGLTLVVQADDPAGRDDRGHPTGGRRRQRSLAFDATTCRSGPRRMGQLPEAIRSSFAPRRRSADPEVSALPHAAGSPEGIRAVAAGTAHLSPRLSVGLRLMRMSRR